MCRKSWSAECGFENSDNVATERDRIRADKQQLETDKQQLETDKQQLDADKQQLDAAKNKRDAKLRELGIDPDTLWCSIVSIQFGYFWVA